MTYSAALRAKGLLTLAAEGQKCQGNTPYSATYFTCAGGPDGAPDDAVHTWEDNHYCAYHSPFDLTTEEKAELKARTTPKAAPQPPTCACGTPLPGAATDGPPAPACIPCILKAADNRLASDRRRLTKAEGRTW